MDRTKFARKLDGLSKKLCLELITAAGLKSRDERLLIAWYIDEKSIYQIAEAEKLQRESAYNAIAIARNRLFDLAQQQADLLPDKVQRIIAYLLCDSSNYTRRDD